MLRLNWKIRTRTDRRFVYEAIHNGYTLKATTWKGGPGWYVLNWMSERLAVGYADTVLAAQEAAEAWMIEMNLLKEEKAHA